MSAYLLLAASAFLAATVVPFYSEVLIVPLALQGYDPLALWLAATSGNTAGAAVNWVLGRFLLHLQDRPWFPFGREGLARAQARFAKYGTWTLLFAWLPVGGDALTFIAGVMRVRFDLFLLLTGAGKGARYWVLLEMSRAV